MVDGVHVAFYGADFLYQLTFLTSPAAKWISDSRPKTINSENGLRKRR